MNFACLYIANFAVQAVMRSEPVLRGRPLVLMEPPEWVFALNADAAAPRAGARRGMSRAEAASLPGVEMRPRSLAAEASAHAALLDLARSFSPRFEDVAADTVVLDLNGLHSLLGPAEKISRDLGEGGRTLGLEANVALAANPDAARLAARGWSGITLIGENEEADRLGTLPVEALDPSLEVSETLERWGIHTLKALASLPPAELSERLGQEGIRLQTLARGGALRALIPAEEPLHFEEAMDLEYSVAEIEPLAFILGRLLSQLCSRLAARGAATQELRLELGLEGGHEDRQIGVRSSKRQAQDSPIESPILNSESRTLRLPFPTRDPRLLLKFWLLDLEGHPPPAPVLKAAITAEPTRPRERQGDLFLPSAPDPQKLELTLARLKGVLGEGKAGCPELLDTHRPDAFRMKALSGQHENRPAKNKRPRSSNLEFRISNLRPPTPLMLRLYRPPLTASVELQVGVPCRVQAGRVGGRVVSAAGPWRASGGWWTDGPWERDEWDVEIAAGLHQGPAFGGNSHRQTSLYRIFQDRAQGKWFIQGTYD